MKTKTSPALSNLSLGLGLFLLSSLLIPLTSPWAYQSPIKPPPLIISYDMSGQPLTITHDGAGVYTFDGLPYPGTVIYTPVNGVVTYQHPEDPLWYTITPAMLQNVVVRPTLSQGPQAKAWQGKPNIRWNITAPQTALEANPNSPLEADLAQAPTDAACPPLFGSTYAASMAGLTVADLAHVLTTLQWLNGGAIVNGCEKLQYTTSQATQIGLPTGFTGPNGYWQLQGVEQTSTSLVPLPVASPITDSARLHLLLIQFGPEDRAELVRAYGHLPAQQQIERISPLLTQETVVP